MRRLLLISLLLAGCGTPTAELLKTSPAFTAHSPKDSKVLAACIAKAWRSDGNEMVFTEPTETGWKVAIQYPGYPPAIVVVLSEKAAGTSLDGWYGYSTAQYPEQTKMAIACAKS